MIKNVISYVGMRCLFTRLFVSIRNTESELGRNALVKDSWAVENRNQRQYLSNSAPTPPLT